jgi:hypothetical protein
MHPPLDTSFSLVKMDSLTREERQTPFPIIFVFLSGDSSSWLPSPIKTIGELEIFTDA